MKPATLRTAAAVLAALFLVSCRSIGPAWRDLRLSERWEDSGVSRRLSDLRLSERWRDTGVSRRLRDSGLSRRLNALSTYEYGIDREPAAALSDFLTEHDAAEVRALFEPRLVEFALNPANTRAGRQHVIRELGRVGTAASAQSLATLLEDGAFADDAAMALQRIPAPEVNGILHEALATATPPSRPRIITVIGHRGDNGAVGIISPLLRDDDEDVVRATAAALGKLATEDAAAALIKALPALRDTTRAAAWDALLACHAAALARHDTTTVRSITALLERAEAPPHVGAGVRLAAWQTASARGAAGEAVKLMASDDPAARSAGAALARNRADRYALAGLVATLPTLPPASQIALMGVFEDRGVTEAATAVANLTSSTDSAIRRAALRTLRAAGTSDSVELLAKSAAEGSDEDRKVARQSLRLLSGIGVDTQVISLSRASPTAVRVELMEAMGDRGMVAALPTLFVATADAEPLIREAAIPQIGELARTAEWPSLLDLFAEENSDRERQLLITAAAAAGKRLPESGPALATRLGTAPGKASRVALIAVAGRLTDDATLTELVRALGSRQTEVCQAALQALGNWERMSAYLPLKVAAMDSDDAQSRRIAQRGAVQVIRKSEGVDEETRVTRYIEIGKCIENAEELRLLLSAVGELRCARAFEVAALFLHHKEVGPEAEAAAIRIAKNMPKLDRETKDTLELIAATSESGPMRNEANTLLGR